MFSFRRSVFLKFSTLAILAAGYAGTVTPARADQAVPDFRFVGSRDVDFYGSDIGSVFDTDFGACVRLCAATADCAAFTYNVSANACFPKREVKDREPFVGAMSAEKVPTDPDVVTRGADRARDLDFLSEAELVRAADSAQKLGLRHPSTGQNPQDAIDAARQQSDAGYPNVAAAWMGLAVSILDRSDLWADYAGYLLRVETSNQRQKRENTERATLAAINAYLRADGVGDRFDALVVLSHALELADRGRDAIPALRLANDIRPDEEIEGAIDRLVSLYGLRITDSTVESDSSAPRICAEFSEDLVQAGVDYEPYVRLPSDSMTVQQDGRQLCIDGAEHGQRYWITFRRGLPAASGEVLYKDVEVTHYVRDRSPSLRFPGRSYVLPRTADAAVPIQSVNAGKAELILRQVSDRNLLRAMQDGLFGRPLWQWEEETLSSDVAQKVWRGTVDLVEDLNRDTLTRIPLSEAIADQPAGIYTLSARVPGADPYDDATATQWFVLSDLGLSTLTGAGGLHVSVRGLSDAAAKSGVSLTLLSRANAVLASATTDEQGLARFDAGLLKGTGASAPAMVLAQAGEADLAFLSLTDPAFDLSDRGVEGRAPSGPVDVFMTTDRGAYRAGETINLTVLSRDGDMRAIEGLPLTAILKRPDGVEYSRRLSGGGDAGGHVFALPVGASAPRGTWQIDIKADPDGTALATQTVLVEDFLPERIDFELSLPDGPLTVDSFPILAVDARYLFGAPGADLSVEGAVLLQGADSLADWPGYRFGRHEELNPPRREYFGTVRTDAAGHADIELSMPEPGTSGRPLELTVTARVSDGAARPVERRVSAPVAPTSPVIGIKPGFEDVVAEGTEARFELVGLAPDLRAMPMEVTWTLNRVETRYQWYRMYGDWEWEPITRRTRIDRGTLTLANGPAKLALPVEWGEYELVVERIGGDYAASSLGFSAGWYAPADSSSTPDRLEMSLDRDSYRAGDVANLRIVPRDGGTALISVLSDRVIARKVVEVPAGESVIPVDVTDEWGTGAYVSATVLRPMDAGAGRNPARALGIAHASVDPSEKELSVVIDAPEIVRPRQSQAVGVTVDGVPEGEEVWLTLAAVDLGILNLTAFESPRPTDHYFGQRRLGVEMRDIYGRLIDGLNGAMGQVRSGGDEEGGMRMQSPPPTQELMAQFSGPVQVGPDGRVEVPIDLPAFNGTVRLMAVAWSRGAVGQAEADMMVRDPVIVTATVPRFLAPGDTSRALLQVVHADGPAGEMQLNLTGVGPVALGDVPGRFDLAENGKAVFPVALTAGQVGDTRIGVTLTTPDGNTLSQDLVLPVRANDPDILSTRRFELAGGQTFTPTGDVFADFVPGTARAILSAGPLARFDAPGLLTALDRYPYGCTEQVTSGALPLLYLSSVAEAAGLGTAPDLDDRIAGAIRLVLSRQASNGAFGLWRAASGDFWLDAYVSDFLSRARAEGHAVPDQAFRQAMDNLRNRINYAPDFEAGGEDLAYALMVLAREGAASMGDLRYYADVKGDAFATPLAAAQLGAALASYGDQTRADAMFHRAARKLQDGETQAGWRDDYGTGLRDAAAVLALATEAGSQAIEASALGDRVALAPGRRSTQEATWTLLAAKALAAAPEVSGLLVNGQPVTGPFVQVFDGGAGSDVALAAADGGRADITLTTVGVPTVPPAAGGTGYSIERWYFDMDGKAIDDGTLTVGDRFVTVLTITSFDGQEARLMVDDPLPAGVEIDNPALLRSGDVGALTWLDLSEATHAEFRSDRFLAAVDHRNADKVTLAYVARAVTPGRFHHPAASVEDMYRPQQRGWTDAGQLVVAE